MEGRVEAGRSMNMLIFVVSLGASASSAGSWLGGRARRSGTERNGKGRNGKGREGRRRSGKGRSGKGRSEKGRERKRRRIVSEVKSEKLDTLAAVLSEPRRSSVSPHARTIHQSWYQQEESGGNRAHDSSAVHTARHTPTCPIKPSLTG